ncbi:hypothetical protein PY247_11125 [Acinetobacter proteolyticus]|nr:hypothetical protein [Acinetobacter proteolyticus]WEI17115.1 hypothetical protein PY247_11125 [Acinetobacter proteolyticus]
MNTKNLQIDWLGNCPKCERPSITVKTVKGSLEQLFDGDKVECWCGQTGEIDTDEYIAWVEWDEVVLSNKDNHDAFYREKYPDYWGRLPGCNHQAWTHYEVSLNSWLVALHRTEAKFSLLPKSITPEIEEILGMPCFKFIKAAQIYRQLGFDIPPKAEKEQSFFMFKFLHLALMHGEKCFEVFESETKTLVEAAKLKSEVQQHE